MTTAPTPSADQPVLEVVADLQRTIERLVEKRLQAEENMTGDDLLQGISDNVLNYAALLYEERELAALLKLLQADDFKDAPRPLAMYYIGNALRSANDTFYNFQPSRSGNIIRDVIFNQGVYAGMQATLATLRTLYDNLYSVLYSILYSVL